jgi:hypothetical protein
VSKTQEPKSGWYSGRTTGVPVAGAIGGGDDFAQRIAKPYIPGRPSQGGMSTSADTTFSISMGNTVPDPQDDGLDGLNIDSINTSKLAGPRRLPRWFKLKKKQYFQRPLSEMITDDIDLEKHEELEADLDEPLHGPGGPAQSRRKFYDRMAKPYGAKYLQDPLKTAKGRP